MNELAQATARNLLAGDPEIEARISRGIEAHRKGDGIIELQDAAGKPVERARLKLRHLRHEFHFGCNGFMLEQFKDAEKNAAYEQRFAELFNLAVVPFYWSDTEPVRGQPRFDRNSPYVYRRPPTDLLLEFCERHQIVPKGHPLSWHMFIPKWAPLDKAGLAAETERRIEAIAARYGDRIRIWDVCNEAVTWDPANIQFRMPERHVEFAFEVASRCLPRSAVLTYNDFACWENHGDYTAMYLLCRHLQQLPQVNFGGIGLQYHMFSPIDRMAGEGDHKLNTRNILAMLDLYGKLGVPVNVSEITISAHPAFGDGPGFQRDVIEHLYRLWFSHPALNGVIYWNLVDDTAFVNPDNPSWDENAYKGGLLHNDLSPKPAYDAIRRLVREEWTTRASLDYSARTNRFRGFYGDYEAVIETDHGTFTRSFKLSRGNINTFRFVLA